MCLTMQFPKTIRRLQLNEPTNFAHPGEVIDSLVRLEFSDSFTANVAIVPLQIAVRVILLMMETGQHWWSKVVYFLFICIKQLRCSHSCWADRWETSMVTDGKVPLGGT